MIQINGQTLSIDGPPAALKIVEIYKKIYLKYPQLVNVNFQILNSQGVAMNKNKTIGDYGIDYNSSTVTAHGIPGYMFGS